MCDKITEEESRKVNPKHNVSLKFTSKKSNREEDFPIDDESEGGTK